MEGDKPTQFLPEIPVTRPGNLEHPRDTNASPLGSIGRLADEESAHKIGKEYSARNVPTITTKVWIYLESMTSQLSQENTVVCELSFFPGEVSRIFTPAPAGADYSDQGPPKPPGMGSGNVGKLIHQLDARTLGTPQDFTFLAWVPLLNGNKFYFLGPGIQFGESPCKYRSGYRWSQVQYNVTYPKIKGWCCFQVTPGFECFDDESGEVESGEVKSGEVKEL